MNILKKILVTSIITVLFGLSIYSVNEGDVGICYKLGSLTNETCESGIHVKMPWPIAKISHVNIRPQTDQINGVFCGTSDGLNLIFENVDVGNTLLRQNVIRTIRKYGEDYDKYLVKDKIRHQTQVICANMTSNEVFNTRFDEIDDLLQDFLVQVNAELDSGLLIDFVRLSKPMIPEAIRKNYEKLAEEKTILKVEAEKQERLKKEAETKQIVQTKELELKLYKSQMEFQIEFEKSQSQNEIQLQKMISEEEQSKVENRMKETKSKIDEEIMKSEARGLTELYNINGYKDYLIAKELSNAMSGHAKFFFGTIPNFLPISLFQTEQLEQI